MMSKGFPFSTDSQSNPALHSSILLVSALFPEGFVLLWGSQPHRDLQAAHR